MFFRCVYQLQPKDGKVQMRDFANSILSGGGNISLLAEISPSRIDTGTTESLTCHALVTAAVSFSGSGSEAFSKL